jgi:hypothetical protein
MKTEYLYMFADFYNVSADYILGLSDSPNPDINERYFEDKTGLSSEAVATLEQMYSENTKGTFRFMGGVFIFDYILKHKNFAKLFCLRLSDYLCKRYSHEPREYINFAASFMSSRHNKEQLGSWNEEMTDIFRYSAIRQVELLIDDCYNDFYKPKDNEHNQKSKRKRKTENSTDNGTETE